SVPTSRLLPTVTPIVYVRRAVGAAEPPINGEAEGWEWDPNLRADHVAWLRGAEVGHARLTYIGTDGAVPEFQDVLGRYSVDDQVRIFLTPLDAPGSESSAPAPGPAPGETEGEEAPGWMIFEGVLARQPFSVIAQGGAE